MTVIICIDKKGGVMFNHRRVSRDKAAIWYICGSAAQGGRLLVSPYSKNMFQRNGELPGHLVVSEDPLAEAGEGDVCFLEDTISTYDPAKVDELVLIHWNRDYPSDQRFPLDDFLREVEEGKWTKRSETVLSGSSHEEILIRIFGKEGWDSDKTCGLRQRSQTFV